MIAFNFPQSWLSKSSPAGLTLTGASMQRRAEAWRTRDHFQPVTPLLLAMEFVFDAHGLKSTKSIVRSRVHSPLTDAAYSR
ncbi:MAG TPA: hypothetical protein VGM63_07985 [Mucilaginibacter sp.]